MNRNSHPKPQFVRSFVNAPQVDHYGQKDTPMYSYEHLFKGYPTTVYDPVNQGIAYSLPLENWPPSQLTPYAKTVLDPNGILTIYPGMNP